MVSSSPSNNPAHLSMRVTVVVKSLQTGILSYFDEELIEENRLTVSPLRDESVPSPSMKMPTWGASEAKYERYIHMRYSGREYEMLRIMPPASSR